MKPLGLSKLGLATHRGVVGTAAALGTGVAICTWKGAPERRHGEPFHRPLKLPVPLVDAIAGALGEVAQILVLYPLDTVKVRCQASGETAAVVLRRLLSNGVNLKLLRKLYAGALGAAACAVVVGAVHFASYEGSRKAFLRLASTSHPNAGGSVSSVHGVQGLHGTHSYASIPEYCTTAAEGTTAPVGRDECRLGRTLATFAAAAVAAVATALVESPVELFRHNAQAGLVAPNFMREMVSTVRREGVGGLYWGFLPHCFEAWPHDIAELATYGLMREFQESASRPISRHYNWASGISEHGWDLMTGAASGVSAVLLSMPFDTVKTYLQTHGADLSGRGVLGSAALFVKSGRRIVARKGLGGLYVGVTPRLLQQVPSAMVCWWSIAAFKRIMEPYTLSDLEGGHGATSSDCLEAAPPGHV
ncbi:hypothetical protein VOLCADRAFT_105233 [Volvox carteri f. nagariensis]|uniref:Mitochondrial carrier protein n=1 Tax=Volvox carteri f. nagariensis TaxID=3068 RepID=D8TZF7_VOLCA|nr:uncharacterized protein VOLCADRAFT_105233 [Volvox carteri f. nagariensis]EFJ47173.1 hypothetical protein VOLCADRAFT_105233 [Volvox carteri f. nagariensis]|eukprot:XP_002951722.1 hypothetical protein VOLCADRAFT_105233 [Volvox carteri f. nagariensis]